MNTTFWEKIQHGDEEAFRQLYSEYSDLLYGYGMKIASDDDLVTESIQSLFVICMRRGRVVPSLSPYQLTCVWH